MESKTKMKVRHGFEAQPLNFAVVSQAIPDDERLALVWERRLRGMSYASIAKDLLSSFTPGALPTGYDAKAVYKDCSAVMVKVRDEYRETAQEAFQLEVSRFDKLLDGVWNAAESGDLNAVDRALAISRERRKMLGLDSPDKMQIDWRVQVVDLLQKGVITPQDIVAEFGEEALLTVNQMMIEKRDE